MRLFLKFNVLELTMYLYRAAADVLYEVLTMMVKSGPLSIGAARPNEL